MVPYADFNLLVFPDKHQAMEKITDLALLSDIFPTGFHGYVVVNMYCFNEGRCSCIDYYCLVSPLA